MQTEAKNKMMNSNPELPTTVAAVSPIENDYFFPGGGMWKPLTIRAATLQDAEMYHKMRRVAVEAPVVEAEPVVSEPVEVAETEVKTEAEPQPEAEVEATQTINE